jgi:hypothetical protein
MCNLTSLPKICFAISNGMQQISYVHVHEDINMGKYCMCMLESPGSTELKGNNIDCEGMGYNKEIKCSKEFAVQGLY